MITIFSSMLFHQNFRESPNRTRLSRSETTRPNNRINFLNGELEHLLCAVRFFKECGCLKVHPHIRALSRQQHCYQKCVGICMIERNRGLGIKFFQTLQNICGPFLFQHAGFHRIDDVKASPTLPIHRHKKAAEFKNPAAQKFKAQLSSKRLIHYRASLLPRNTSCECGHSHDAPSRY